MTTKTADRTARQSNGKVELLIIRPGQGATGFYTPEVLQQAALDGVFDNVPIFRNHPGTGQRTDRPDVDLTVGYIEPGAKYMEKGPKGPGVYGNAVILAPHKDMVYSFVDTPFGVSIHADGQLERPGDTTSPVLQIDKAHSVDLVVRPGAGGAVTKVLESARLRRIGNVDLREETGAITQILERHVPGDKNEGVIKDSRKPPIMRTHSEQAIRKEAPMYRIFEDDNGDQYGLLTEEILEEYDIYEDEVIEGDDGQLYYFLGNVYESDDDDEPVEEDLDESELEEEEITEEDIREWAEYNDILFEDLSEDDLTEVAGIIRAARQTYRGARNMGAGRGTSAGAAGIAGRRAAGQAMSSARGAASSAAGRARGAAGRAAGRARGAAGRARGAASSAAGRARGAAGRARGAASGAMGRARGAASSARGRASGAASAGRARVGGMSRQAKIGAGIGAAGVAAGAGGAAALASRRKREESADNGLDEMREQFNYLTEAVKALQQQMAQPDQEEEIQESARVNATGSSNARSLIEQAALEFTDDPSKAAHFGKMVGKIIEADRGDRQGHWSMRDWSSWQDGEGMPDGNTTVTDSFQERDEKPARTPQRVPVGATGVFASGGGNSTLTEQAGSSSWSDDIDRLLSEVYN